MFCFTGEKFQNILNKTISERFDEYWYDRIGNGKYIFAFFNIIFLLIPNCLWIRGILKTNQRLSLPQKLNLFSGSIGLTQVFLLFVDTFFSLANILSKSCWKSTLAVSFSFVFILLQINVVFTSILIRYTYLAYPLKQINSYTIYIALFMETLVSFALGAVYLISDLVAIESLEVALLQGLAVLLILISPFDAVLIAALNRALSKFSVVNKEASKNHSKAVKRLTIVNILGILFTLPFSISSLYYSCEVDLNDLMNLFEMDFALTCSYFVMITYNGFVPFINVLWNDKIRRYYKFKRATVQMSRIKMTILRKSLPKSQSDLS